ncbi:hypothetical protein chiPu_0028195 [Chiloscyllium punctatum]|uniref:Uncharacterized protein n=1 Tax=Chiloscyllium punctatum TaxID=137246 RepID=A0A401TN38_CHIPU|nr:hypothetical protein [Chiloscyllium punctatum]
MEPAYGGVGEPSHPNVLWAGAETEGWQQNHQVNPGREEVSIREVCGARKSATDWETLTVAMVSLGWPPEAEL